MRRLCETSEAAGGHTALELVAQAEGSAERLAWRLATGMAFDDRGFYKRAQIVPNDLALAGVAEFADLDRLTIFADNLVPHVLRVDGVLRYDSRLAARMDAGELLPQGEEEREIRACALHACELIAARLGTPPRLLDTWLWSRGRRVQGDPRHRTRTVYYAAGRIRTAAAVERLHVGPLGFAAGQLGQQLLHLGEPVGQAADRVGHRVGEMDPVSVGAARLAAVHRARDGRGFRPRWRWPAS